MVLTEARSRKLRRRGASVSLSKVHLTLLGIPLEGRRRVALDGICSKDGDEPFCGEFFGVASRSSRLMSEARSFVAASRIESTPDITLN